MWEMERRKSIARLNPMKPNEPARFVQQFTKKCVQPMQMINRPNFMTVPDAKARVLVIGKELMYAEEPEKEEDEYGTFGFE